VGSKNRIYLGVVVAIILHLLRNTFHRHIYMSKRVESKIKSKHPESFVYTKKANFLQLLENTIAYLPYANSTDTYNFIAYMPDSSEFILYALKSEKHHTNCITIFKLRKSTLKKYCNDDNIVFVRSYYRTTIEDYIN